MDLKWIDDDSLRQLAEESVIRARPTDPGVSREKILYELRVHQAELEMQNDALREAQVELAGSHARFKDWFDHAPVGYIIVDTTSRIKAANEAAGEVLGASPSELIGVRFSRYLQSDDAVGFERYRREVLRSRTRLTAEFTIHDARGRLRELRLDGLCQDPEIGEWRIALTDVTTHNSLARKLDHGERLGTIGRHASSIAHDLNNFLYSVIGHADVALQCLTAEDDAYGPVVRLQEVAHRCAAATKQLSTFARAEAVEPSVVDLNFIITGMQSELRSLLGADIVLELNLTASDAAVRIDASHIEQIVLNAVRNARDAMPRGGTFFIETASVELSGPVTAHGTASARCVRWSMSDTGIGMDESTRRRAFEAFYTTKPSGRGTGLGLSMVKAAVERAGGNVALETSPGQGTSLVIHLPRATGFSRAPSELESGEVASVPFASVMVVDDDAESRARIAARLRGAGCDVVQAGSSGEALDLLGRLAERLGVLLVDEALPDFVIGEFMRAAHVLSPALEVIVARLDAPASPTANGPDSSRDPLEETLRRVLSAASRSIVQ
jgi:PAS domain S-box-containing protein